MSHFQIKVCGLTRPGDADLVGRLGVDMAGMIFCRRSPRFVSLAQARRVTAVLPPVIDRVGVFVGEEYDLIMRRAEQLRLDYVQLHDGETNRQIRQFQQQGLKVICAFHVCCRSDYKQTRDCAADLILLDNHVGEMRGGTGKTFDWGLRPPRRMTNIVLAGGLNSLNVGEGVRKFSPMVVDVNSGVEQAPGQKSAAKLKKFIRACNKIRTGN